MEIVIPRWRSSGALSIWSNADAWFSVGYLSCSTLVIAAVSVVLPWSMCPMVPMLTCGLVRSNLALATGAPSGFLALRSRGVDGILVCADRGVPVNSEGRGQAQSKRDRFDRAFSLAGHSPRAFWMISSEIDFGVSA